MELPKIEFDLDAFVDLGAEVVKDALKYDKASAEAVRNYQQEMSTLVYRIREGEVDPESAKKSLARYGKAMDLALAGAREKMNWKKVRQYREANQQLLDFAIATLFGFVKAL